MLAPIFRNGSTTRAIGRRLSDASPSRVADTRLPARTPARRRIVVPEFAQSSGPCGVENPRGEIRSPHPDASPRAGEGETGDSLTPRLRRQATVALTSSPGGSPVITLSPSARAPRISARCAIDLSPGTRSVPATRVAGSTSSTTPSSTRRMDTSAKEISHPIAAVDAPDQAKPLVDQGELLLIDRRESPCLPPEQRGVALAQPAPLLPGDRMATEELGRLRQTASPFQHGALDTGDIGDDGGATDNP